MEFTDSYTMGKLYIDNEYFCDTIEDTNRDLNKNGIFDNNETKVYGETCIPFGIYSIIMNYSPRFKKVLPLLLNVPSFEGVRIHAGNTAQDSHGCILVGIYTGNGFISNSKVTLEKLINKLNEAFNITIEII